MFISSIKSRLLFLGISFCIYNILIFLFFQQIFSSNYILIDFALHPFNICEKYPDLWSFIKATYIFSSNLSFLIISNLIYSLIFSKEKKENSNLITNNISQDSKLNLLVGTDSNHNLVHICEKGLYQNILITGTIGSGKTSSAMYPFTRQLIEYKANNNKEKLGLLI